LSFYGAKSVSLSGRFDLVFGLTDLTKIYWVELKKLKELLYWLEGRILTGD
jgi:hypothetical protein